MSYEVVETFWVNIHIAGDYTIAKRICSKFCFENPLCVQLQKCDYIYPGGCEEGVKVRLINYPRFPEESWETLGKARMLADTLMEELGQWSYTVETPDRTYWYSRRDDNGE